MGNVGRGGRGMRHVDGVRAVCELCGALTVELGLDAANRNDSRSC